MNIDRIGFEQYRAVDSGYPGRSHRIEAGVNEVRKKTGSQVQVEASPVADEPEPREGEEMQEARGVLRLLQEGHFKGVADLRLRINFAEELAGIELAEPSAPQGNGKAHQKFLEIYRGMQKADEAEMPEDSDPVDTLDDSEPIEPPETPDPIDAVA